jgi:hypothetical protein
MAIDTSREELLTFAQAAHRCRPAGCKPVSPSTLWRWHRKGIAGVKLETICLGGTRFVSSEGLSRFFTAVTEAKSGEEPGVPAAREVPTAKESQRSAGREKRLKETGLL